MMTKNPFFIAALDEVPRLLGQIDRNPLSRTYGSCDRAFWLYRTNDISSMRYQEAALTLALLYTTDFEDNQYHHDPKILSWANAAIAFALSRQHSDGSFDEWYLNEGSFVCTAFVSAALAETALVLGDHLDDRKSVVSALEKSGTWLMNHSETLVVNQLSGAMYALQNIFLLSGNIEFEKAAEEKCAMLLSLQDSEGWWSEYGGPDIGYLSLAIDYLSRYAEKSKKIRKLEPAIERAASFLGHFLHPDGTAGGEYMARNTEYLIPSGVVRAAPYSASARSSAAYAAGIVMEKKGISPRTLDDRYVCYILYNWIEAGVLWNQLAEKPLPKITSSYENYRQYFPHAGLYVEHAPAFHLFINLKKGGSFRLYTRDSLIVDTGVALRKRNEVFAGNVFSQETTIFYDESTAAMRAAGTLIKVRAPLLTTARAIVLKTAQFCVGRISVLQKILKRTLRRVGVQHPGHASNIRFERSFKIDRGGLTVTDVVYTVVSQDMLTVGEDNTYALVPSSRYVSEGQVWARARPSHTSFELIGGQTRLSRTFVL